MLSPGPEKSYTHMYWNAWVFRVQAGNLGIHAPTIRIAVTAKYVIGSGGPILGTKWRRAWRCACPVRFWDGAHWNGQFTGYDNNFANFGGSHSYSSIWCLQRAIHANLPK